MSGVSFHGLHNFTNPVHSHNIPGGFNGKSTPTRVTDSQEGTYNEVQRRYFNVAVIGTMPTNNAPNSNTPAAFDQTFRKSILDRPKEWVCGLVRFSIPIFNVPIFTDPQFDTPSNPAIISWYNATFFPNGISATITVPYTVDAVNPSYVYEIQSWIDAIQNAMNTLTTLAIAAGATWDGLTLVPPLVTYNPTNQLITIQAQSGLFYPSPAITGTYAQAPIFMYLNAEAYRFLPTLPCQDGDSAALINSALQNTLVRMGGLQSLPSWNVPLGGSNNLPVYTPTAPFGLGTVASTLTTTTLYGGFTLTTLAIDIFPGENMQLTVGNTYTPNQTVTAIKNETFILAHAGNTGVATDPFTTVSTYTAATGAVWLTGGITAIIFAVPMYIAPGTVLTLSQGTNSQQVITSVAANSGDAYVSVVPFFPNFAYVPGTARVFPTVTQSAIYFDSITTETAVPSTWTGISSIRITTNYIPIVPEYSPAIQQAGTDVTQLPGITMLTDFVIGTSGLSVTRDVLQYVTDQPRYMDMLGDSPLDHVDIYCFWVDLKGIAHQIYLNKGERLDVKFNFRRKFTLSGPGF